MYLALIYDKKQRVEKLDKLVNCEKYNQKEHNENRRKMFVNIVQVSHYFQCFDC